MAATNTYEYLRCNLNTIEDIIGYRFQDRNLLIQAFTSKSFGAENPSFEDNDVLEFYGDAELYKFLSDWLYDSFTVYPDGKRSNKLTSKKSVGELSEIRKNYICFFAIGFTKNLHQNSNKFADGIPGNLHLQIC